MRATPKRGGPRGISLPEALACLLAAVLVLGLGVKCLAASYPSLTQSYLVLGTLGGAVYFLASGLLAWRAPSALGFRESVGLRTLRPSTVFTGFALGLLLQAPAELLAAGLDSLWPLDAAEEARRLQALVSETGFRAVGLALVLAAWVPWAEELFFRGALYGALRRGGLGERGAGLACALGFTLSHFDPRAFLPLFVVALVLGQLRRLSGSVALGVAVHAGFNFWTVLAAQLGWNSSPVLTRPELLLALSVLAGLGFYDLATSYSRDPEAQAHRQREASGPELDSDDKSAD